MKIEPHVLTVLENAEVTGNQLVLTGQLDRKTYTDTNKVLLAIGGKWNRKAGAHIFDEAPDLDMILATGEYTRVKQDFGQFDTPAWLAQEVVRRAGINSDHRVLEPSAGMGNIASASRNAGGDTDCIEIDAKRVQRLRELGFVTQKANFMDVTPDQRYDRVVMNPPFAKQADIAHVTHAARFLRPGGRLVSIMSAGISFRTDTKTTAFRDIIHRIEHLPKNSFSDSGTNVGTVIVEIICLREQEP